MPARDGWWFVPFEPSPETVIRIGWISAALGFLIAIVSAVGEVLGWWDLWGEIGMTVGSLLGIVATFTTLSFTAGRDQVTVVRRTVEGIEETSSRNHAILRGNNEVLQDNNDVLQANNEVLQANNEVLADNNDKLGEATVTLDGIEHALVQQDGRTSKLDVVQAELDRQTGVLDRQVEILAAIRDGL